MRVDRVCWDDMGALVSSVGGSFLRMLVFFGQLVSLFLEVVRAIFTGRVRVRLFFEQVVLIGYGSQLVVMVAGAFTGAVFAAQAYFKFSEVGLETATGPVVALAMARELGPVLAGVMVAGRIGAAMAAEIGTMKVTEQIDALRSLAVDPVDYLVVPRTLAILVSMPVLVAEAILLGVLAGRLITVDVYGVPLPWFVQQIEAHTGVGDYLTGLIKGAFFGGIIVIVSCLHGLRASGGAVGVGQATTRAVVDSCLGIIVANLFLTLILNDVFPMVPAFVG